MKKRMMSILLSMALAMTLLGGCGSKNEDPSVTEMAEGASELQTTDVQETAETVATEETAATEETTPEQQKNEVAVGSLKGATSIGLLKLMHDAEHEETLNNYTFTMATQADELLPRMISGDLDIALIPANVASVLYKKTEGGISVVDINTLGVLYMVSGDASMSAITDLKGKTIYLTGKGTTPDYVLHYILTENGLTDADVTLEYKSEATEVAAVLAEDAEAVGLLPQPFVTAACAQNDKLQIVFDMTKEWNTIQGAEGSALVTGVTVATNTFIQEQPETLAAFLEEHKNSAAYANEHVEEAATWTEDQGIIAKAAIARQAIPFCNITYIDGKDMKKALSGYLQVLFDQDPKAVGGALPADDFYYGVD